jgi:hypothetical protein
MHPGGGLAPTERHGTTKGNKGVFMLLFFMLFYLNQISSPSHGHGAR